MPKLAASACSSLNMIAGLATGSCCLFATVRLAFFSDDELAASKGVQWYAAEAGPPTIDAAPIDSAHASAKRAFSA